MESVLVVAPASAAGVRVIPTVACPGCALAALACALRATPQECPDCRAAYTPLPGAVPEPMHPARPPRPARTLGAPPPSRVRGFTVELLMWHRAVLARAVARDRVVAGGSYVPVPSGGGLGAVLRQLALRIVGDGNKGTRGVWRGHAAEPEAWVPPECECDPRSGARYHALGERERATADAVIADAQGFGLVDVTFDADAKDPKVFPLTLAQRVGWALAGDTQQRAWARKILARDSFPALAGMGDEGGVRLDEAADAWWADEDDEGSGG